MGKIKDSKIEEDTIWTIITEDSMKINYRIRGDTLFTQAIDLSSGEDDSFDKSYNNISILDSKKTKPINKPEIIVKWFNLLIHFNKESLINTASNKIKYDIPIMRNMIVLDLSHADHEPPKQVGFNDILKLEEINFISDTLVAVLS